MGYITYKVASADATKILHADNILSITPDDNKLNIYLDSGIGHESTTSYTTGVQVLYADGAFLASSVVEKWREAIAKASGLQGGAPIVVDESGVSTSVNQVVIGRAELPNLSF